MLKTACGNGFPLNIPSVIPESGGSGGTSDYSDLTNKPQINSVTLSGNKSLSDIGAASASDVSDIQDLIPSDASTTNLLATADDIPGVATTSAPGIVQPDGTTITVSNGVISAVGGGGGGGTVTGGGTNISKINWLRYGNVVVVTSNGAIASTSGTAITGLPLPYGGEYQVGACYNQTSMVANIIYDRDNGWRIVGTGSGAQSAYGSLAYIAADN